MGESDAERMARLEARFDSLEAIMLRMNVKLDAWNDCFMPRKETEARFESVANELNDIKNNRRNMWNNVPFWISTACGLVALVYSIVKK